MEDDEEEKPKSKKSKKKSKKKPNQTITTEENEDSNPVLDKDEQNSDNETLPQTTKMSKAKLKRAKKANKGKKDNNEVEAEGTDTMKSCAVCGSTFDSKNKLFSHLKSTGHAVYVGKDSKGQPDLVQVEEKGSKKKKNKFK